MCSETMSDVSKNAALLEATLYHQPGYRRVNKTEKNHKEKAPHNKGNKQQLHYPQNQL